MFNIFSAFCSCAICIPSFSKNFSSRIFTVLSDTTRMSQFLEALFLDVMLIWMTPCIFLFLLKHLILHNWVVVLLMLLPSSEIILFAVEFYTKLRGLPVLTSHCNVVSHVWVSIQNSPSSDLLILLIFVSVHFSIKITLLHFSII